MIMLESGKHFFMNMVSSLRTRQHQEMVLQNTKDDEPITWFTFYSHREKREYYYEPISGTTTWVAPSQSDGIISRLPALSEMDESNASMSERYFRRKVLPIITRPSVAVAMFLFNLVFVPMLFRACSQRLVHLDVHAPTFVKYMTVGYYGQPSQQANEDAVLAVDQSDKHESGDPVVLLPDLIEDVLNDMKELSGSASRLTSDPIDETGESSEENSLADASIEIFEAGPGETATLRATDEGSLKDRGGIDEKTPPDNAHIDNKEAADQVHLMEESGYSTNESESSDSATYTETSVASPVTFEGRVEQVREDIDQSEDGDQIDEESVLVRGDIDLKELSGGSSILTWSGPIDETIEYSEGNSLADAPIVIFDTGPDETATLRATDEGSLRHEGGIDEETPLDDAHIDDNELADQVHLIEESVEVLQPIEFEETAKGSSTNENETSDSETKTEISAVAPFLLEGLVEQVPEDIEQREDPGRIDEESVFVRRDRSSLLLDRVISEAASAGFTIDLEPPVYHEVKVRPLEDVVLEDERRQGWRLCNQPWLSGLLPHCRIEGESALG